MDQMQNRRIAAVKAADAINAIEGIPVSDYAIFFFYRNNNRLQPENCNRLLFFL